MDYLGLFSLGVFVGAIASLGVRYVSDVKEWQIVLAAALPAVLSGVALAFVDRFKYSPAIGCYPLGLVIALMWTYADTAVKSFVSGASKSEKTIGLLHLVAATLASLAGAILVLIPAVIQVHAEYMVPQADRIKTLGEERKMSLEGQQMQAKPQAKETPKLPAPPVPDAKKPPADNPK